MNPYIPIGISIFFGVLSPALTVLGMLLTSRGENAKAQAAFAERIDSLRVMLADIRAENKGLADKVNVALTGNAVTDQQLNALNTEMKRIDAAHTAFVAQCAANRDTDMRARHDLREELHAMLREMERRLEDRLPKVNNHT